MRIGSLLALGLIAAALAVPLPVQAADQLAQKQSGQQAPGMQKGDGIPSTPQECIKDKGCLAQDQSGQTASNDGVTCTSGMACTFEGASCAIGGTRHCKTWDLDGAGNCTCACVAP